MDDLPCALKWGLDGEWSGYMNVQEPLLNHYNRILFEIYVSGSTILGGNWVNVSRSVMVLISACIWYESACVVESLAMSLTWKNKSGLMLSGIMKHLFAILYVVFLKWILCVNMLQFTFDWCHLLLKHLSVNTFWYWSTITWTKNTICLNSDRRKMKRLIQILLKRSRYLFVSQWPSCSDISG